MPTPRKPDAIHRLHGNPSKKKLGGGAPPPIGGPVRPPYLSGYAIEVWNRLIKSMPPGILTSADSELLGAYCLMAKQQRDAQERLAVEDAVIDLPSGARMKNPWSTIANTAARNLATIGARLGLDPNSRNSINVPSEPPRPSKFAGLINFPEPDRRD